MGRRPELAQDDAPGKPLGASITESVDTESEIPIIDRSAGAASWMALQAERLFRGRDLLRLRAGDGAAVEPINQQERTS